MSSLMRKGAIQVQYAFRGGAHCFTSPDVRALRVIGPDLGKTYAAVSVQLSEIFEHETGTPVQFAPAHPVEEFERWRDEALSAKNSALRSVAETKWTTKTAGS